MHFSAALLAVTAALGGVAAHPSGHAHAYLHAKKDAVEAHPIEFKKASRPHTTSEPVPVAAEPSPARASAASTPSAASSSSSSSSPTSSSGGQGFVPFCGGDSTSAARGSSSSSSSNKRATYDQIMYSGNTGTPGDWGCNMKIIDKVDTHAYKYVSKFVSTGGKFACSCFNKVGPKGLLDGFWFSAVDFSVSDPGRDDVYMAFDTNSQGSCACAPGNVVDRTDLGQLAGTWFEWDWGSEPNGGNSGADVSVLVAGAMDMPYYGMSIAANGKVCSWVKSDGSNEDAYMPGMEDLDGIGCKGYYEAELEVLLGDNF
ncbi:hypothetical protein SODALDRAFT_338219 [Sodiomyces alkalinus F11]|uniref:Allergen Asp f 4 n=1 Tax=Sodiomyces alkalinus (strain CBS 110278 / VKM F-3762 / F11) TaxID=1314773 RepID=A0A3N2Q1C2_SODAK|nr:hypothetical protein SODALDRAFT_338219 [Sodiomyces alkalinus F11]ROT40415.1 hypothetical protein SODALDRAFT_338219 [Sodiomyces alkalinus F11]